MSDKIFDLEQQILQCWHVTDDIDTITTWFVDHPDWAKANMSAELCDALMNKYFGIKELYDVKFQKMFETFEEVCKEYHTYRKISEEEM